MVHDEAGQPLYYEGTVRDITARKQAEMQNTRLLHEAQTANRAKSQFLASMSHDLRTPLNSILGFLGLMRDGIYGALGDVRCQEYVNIVSKTGRYLLSLIDDILDVARIERGKYIISPVEIDIRKLIDTTIVRLTGLDKAIPPDRFIVTVPDGAPVLHADECAIAQILDNIIWHLDVSSGFDDIGKWCADEVNDGDEGRGLSIAPGFCASGFEDAVHSFEAGFGVVRLPSP